jgi:hypothetical protein
MATYLIIDYKDLNNDQWQINIGDANYTGDINRLDGYAVIEYPKIKDVFEPIRGSRMVITLDQNKSNRSVVQRFIDEVGDRIFETKLFKNGQTVWSGYLKPDGITESFVLDYWQITIEAIDGLGYAENIAYLDEDGQPFTGLQREMDIIGRCLQLIGQPLRIRYYDSFLRFSTEDDLPVTDFWKPIILSYINAERFVKNDQNNSVFTVKEVLIAVLAKYGMCIYQFNNRWYIIRVKAYFRPGIKPYTEHVIGTLNPVVNVLSSQNLKTLGSQVNGFMPHHASANQRITYNSSLGAFKVVYEYGFLKNILDNGRLIFNNTTTLDGWDNEGVNNVDYDFVTADPFPKPPLLIFAKSPINQDPYALLFTSTSNPTVSSGNILQLIVRGRVVHTNQIMRLAVRVLLVGNSTTTYYLNDDLTWVTSQQRIFAYNRTVSAFTRVDTNFEATFQSVQLPEDGEIIVQILKPFRDGIFMANDGGFYNLEVIVNGNVPANIQGESWTATRIGGRAAAVVDLKENVVSADNDSGIYVGALVNSSGTNTVFWAEKAQNFTFGPERRLLDLYVRSRLEASGGNAMLFQGGIYGYLPYDGRLNIDGLEGNFMTVQYSWNTRDNTIQAEHVRIYNDDIEETTDVEFNFEGPETVRPAIE